MHLSPHEQERLLIHVAADVAQRRRESGLLLNYPEVMALLAAYISEQARAGRTVNEIMTSGTQLIRRDEVMEGVPEMIEFVQMEATFPDGTKLVTLHDPIPRVEDAEIYPGKVEHPRPPREPDCPVECGDGTGQPPSSCCEACDDKAAWYEAIKFNEHLQEPHARTKADRKEIGKGKTKIKVRNTSDRAVQVGSHHHFAEVNPGLKVEEIEIPADVDWTGTDLATCPAAHMRRLNIPAGTSLRFEPGDECCVELVDIEGQPPTVKGLRKGVPFTGDQGTVV